MNPIFDCSLATLARFTFLELHDAPKFSTIAELWFLAFNASVEIHPVMLSEDPARPRGIPSASRREDDPFPCCPAEYNRGRI